MDADRKKLAVIYKITYPNGKIYVGKDLTGTLTYFGSPNHSLIAADFSELEQSNFTITKEILWSSMTATSAEISAKEVEFIVSLQSNNPSVGYNRWPRFKG